VSRPAGALRPSDAWEPATPRRRSLAALLRAAWVEYERDRAGYLAVAMIYYALLSLVPLLSLLLAALGLLLRFSQVAADTRQQMLVAIDARFGPDLSAAITQLLTTLQQESIVATIISLGGVLFAASLLFKHLRLTFRAIWRYDPPLIAGSLRGVVRETLLERVISFLLMFGGGGLLLAALVLIAASQWVGGTLPLGDTTASLVAAATSVLLAAVTFACMFRFLPPVPIRWRDVRLAAVLCALAWVIASELLALFGGALGGALGGTLSTYSALGGVLAVMLWLNVVSQVLFFGAELCKVVATHGGDSPPTGR
jgi:membrane protein